MTMSQHDDYPLHSVWEHNTLGRVTISHHLFAIPPSDCYDPRPIPTLQIVDSAGRLWSCYSPHTDLRPSLGSGPGACITHEMEDT